MYVPMKRWVAVLVGVLAVVGLSNTKAHGQWGLNPNFYANPFMAQQMYGGALLGQAIRNQAILNTQAMLASAAYPVGYGYGGYGLYGGYGALARATAAYNLGYAALLNGGYGMYGGYGGYGLYGGYGYGTQWMMNPYEGYLQGAAAVTNANANYHLTIQQAKLMRQEAIRSSYQTRRAAIEEAEYERAHMPDPERIRQGQLARELDRARVSPPLTEVWSARSLNTLLRNAIAQQSQGVRGPNVPISEDTLKAINLTAGDTRGSVGLLKDNGNLQWPQPLQGEAFKDAREDLSKRMKQAVQTVQLNRGTDEGALNDMLVDWKKLSDTLDASVNQMSPDQYIESRRYLRQLGDALTALKDRNVSNFFSGNWVPHSKNVAELVKFMADKGLWFAPAAPGEESAYLALYHALAAFDAGMPRVAANSGTNYGDR